MAAIPTIEIPTNGTDEPQGNSVVCTRGIIVTVPRSGIGALALPAPDLDAGGGGGGGGQGGYPILG